MKIALLLATRLAFSFLDNRTLGHQVVGGGLRLDAATPGFAKYIRFSRFASGWTWPAKHENKPVAWAANQAVLEVPVWAGRQGPLTLRLFSPQAQKVSLSVGGKPAGQVALTAGWQQVSIPIGEGLLADGENELKLGFTAGGKKAAAVAWAQLGGAAPESATTLSSRGAIPLPMAFWNVIPAKATLTGEGGDAGAAGTGGACKLQAKVTAEGGQTAAGALPLDLSALAGQVARVELSGCGQASQAELRVPGEAPKTMRTPRPRNVVIWLTDNTRADHWSAYNPKTRVQTPNVDRLVATGTVFGALAQGNESRVSHASLWTSLYPVLHKMYQPKQVLPESLVTMAEPIASIPGSGGTDEKPIKVFRGAVSANGYASKRWGFAQGWSAFRNNLHEGGGNTGADVIKTAFGLLKPHLDEPFFFYIGTIDSHTSWRPHEPWLSRYDAPNGPYKGPFVKGLMDPQMGKIAGGKLKPTDRDRLRLRAIYDATVSYNDAMLGAFLEVLAKSGHDKDTMVIITSDHGEEFWERGKLGHGQSLYNELVWVPFLIHYPPLFPKGRVEGAELVDIMPTVLDALGVAIPPAWQGESLLPVAHGEGVDYPRATFASHYEITHAMRIASYKLWVGSAGNVKLFDLAADPGEAHDAAAARPAPRRLLTDAMGVFLAFQKAWKKGRWGTASNHKSRLAPELSSLITGTPPTAAR